MHIDRKGLVLTHDRTLVTLEALWEGRVSNHMEQPPDLIGNFLRDLEELSRRHGIWIKGSNGLRGDLPEVYAAYGDEQGYTPYVLNRGNGELTQHFDVASAAHEWLTGDHESRGPAPDLLRKAIGK